MQVRNEDPSKLYTHMYTVKWGQPLLIRKPCTVPAKHIEEVYQVYLFSKPFVLIPYTDFYWGS